MSVLGSDEPSRRPLAEQRRQQSRASASPAGEALAAWIDVTSERYVDLLDRIDRAYLNAETCAKAADERARERAAAADDTIGEQPFIGDEQLPRVHIDAMQAYAGVASALLSSVREMQLSLPIEMPIHVRS